MGDNSTGRPMLQTVATLDLEFGPWVLTGSASLDHGLGAQWSVVASLDLRPKLSGQWSPVKEPPPHGTVYRQCKWPLALIWPKNGEKISILWFDWLPKRLGPQ